MSILLGNQMRQANTAQDGFLSSTDWNTFNNKQNNYIKRSTPATRGVLEPTNSGDDTKYFSTLDETYPVRYDLFGNHDSIYELWDCYYEPTDSTIRSSTATGNYQVYKQGGKYTISGAAGVAPGDQPSFSKFFTIDAAASLITLNADVDMNGYLHSVSGSVMQVQIQNPNTASIFEIIGNGTGSARLQLTHGSDPLSAVSLEALTDTAYLGFGALITNGLTIDGPVTITDTLYVDYIYSDISAGVGMHLKNSANNGNITLEAGLSGDIALLAPSNGRILFLGSKLRMDINNVTSDGRLYVDEITNNAGVVLKLNATSGGAIRLNENTANVDTIIRGDADVNLFYADASTDRIGIGTNTPLTKFHNAGGYTGNVTTINTATHNLGINDYILNVTRTSAGNCVITVPSAQFTTGRIFHVKDAGGNAAANHITLNTEGSEKIDNQDTFIIDQNNMSASFYCDGANLFVI